MKCQVCGNESGKYVLCRECNEKKDEGLIAKCKECNKWHYISQPCAVQTDSADNSAYLYEAKPTLITNNESEFYNAIKSALPEGYIAFPQINLAAFVTRTDGARFHNELFRNVDFLITDATYKPLIIVEINDPTHLSSERKERDEKVKNICDEAGIPIINLWTNYGVKPEYIKKRIDETIASLPVKRVHHFDSISNQSSDKQSQSTTKNEDQGACYVATCVYGSYDCPQVWTLRRYRDHTLVKTWYGRAFIRVYYAISPTFVKWFGHINWFKHIWKNKLDKIVTKLTNQGIETTPYAD